MKILSWNCRGLSRPTVVRSLRALIRDHASDVLFLSETKISPSQVSVTLNRLGFFLISQVASCGFSGGLALTQRPSIDLECFIFTKNTIFAWCYSDPPHSPWILSCVCGPPDRIYRQAFWDSFTSVGDNFDPFWLCIGDVNAVLTQDDKTGARLVAHSANFGFKNFIKHFGMVDLGFVGNPFTFGAIIDMVLIPSKKDLIDAWPPQIGFTSI